MKRLITISLLTSFLLGFSQGYQSIKEELLMGIYGNTPRKVINNDKSFVSDDRLFYESIDGIQTDNPPPNKTVVRLIILNKNGDILMKESSLGWVTIASFYTQRQSFNEVIDSLTSMYGVKITKPNLGGVFTYKYNFKKSADTRLLYVAKHIGGEIKQGKNDYYFTWFPKEEAIKKLKNTVPSLGEMTEQILDAPNKLWGGSFFINRDANGKLNSQIIEGFYPLRGNLDNQKQKEYGLIEKTLQKYMEGSSYAKLDMLESAFAGNATLYLTNRDGIFQRYTPKEYTGFFKNAETGKFNGRNTKVLAIEVVKDIATAKVEIAGPERKWVYIDLFLLKKIKDGWRIISKTATRVDKN